MKRENISDALAYLDEEIIEPTARLRAGFEGCGGERTDGCCADGLSGESAAMDGVPVDRLPEEHAVADKKGVQEGGVEMNQRRRKRGLGALAAAACMGILCVAAAVSLRISGRPQEEVPQEGSGVMTGDAHMPGGATVTPGGQTDETERGMPADTGDTENVPGNTENVPGDVEEAPRESFVAPESLFADETDGITENGLMITSIPVGSYEAVYEGVASVGSDVLEKSLGAQVAGAEGFYGLGGHEDLQYVISDNEQAKIKAPDGERYMLWEFQSFQAESYPYSDVLKLVYGMGRADAIAKLVVMPPTFDNTDEGLRIQKEIGTYEVTDRDDIKAFFEIIWGMTCYGSDHWDMIDYGSTEMSVDGEGAHDPVRLARYVTLVSERGCAIGRLKYTAVSDMFYEYGGIAYEPLEKKQAARMQKLLGIQN